MPPYQLQTVGVEGGSRIAYFASDFIKYPDMAKIVVGEDKQEFMVHTFLWKQSGMLLVEVTTRDGNVELTSIGVNEVEPAVFSFVAEWLYEYRGRDYVMTQLGEWRMESTDQLLHELHQEVIIRDLAKLMINQGLESWDPNKFKLADSILDVCLARLLQGFRGS